MKKLVPIVISVFMITAVFAIEPNDSVLTCLTDDQMKQGDGLECSSEEGGSCTLEYLLNGINHTIYINNVKTATQAKAILSSIGPSHSLKPSKSVSEGFYYCTYQPWPELKEMPSNQNGIYIADVFIVSDS